MNKIILYVGLAILLGTVTMVAPLALLQDDNPLSDDKFFVKTSGAELENQKRNDCQTLDPEIPPSDSVLEAPEPSEPATGDYTALSPEEPESFLGLDSDDSGMDLSPVALITIPSFLVALGVFVLLRRQVS